MDSSSGDFIAWTTWLVVQIFLIGSRQRIFVLFDWA